MLFPRYSMRDSLPEEIVRLAGLELNTIFFCSELLPPSFPMLPKNSGIVSYNGLPVLFTLPVSRLISQICPTVASILIL